MIGFLALWIVLQAAAGCALVGVAAALLARRPRLTRRKRVKRAEAARVACRITAVAVPLAALTAGALWMAGVAFPVAAVPGGWPASLLLGGVGVCGALSILAAGRSEARGRRRRAARRVDLAGRVMFLACAGYAVVLLGATVLTTAASRATLLPAAWSPALLALAATTVGLAGFLGLLAGLSRKPRPTGAFAALCYVASQAVLLAAIGAA